MTVFQEGLQSRKHCPIAWDSWTEVQAPKVEKRKFMRSLFAKTMHETQVGLFFAGKGVGGSKAHLVSQMVEYVVDQDNGDAGEVAVFDFGEGGTADTYRFGQLCLAHPSLFSETLDRITNFE